MLVDIKNVSKRYGKKAALDSVDLQIDSGEIVGLFGPNGAGKTTLLRAALGLSTVEGHIRVAGLNPATQAPELMKQVSFIADTAILPSWIKVKDALQYVQAVHPKFDIEIAEDYLKKTKISPTQKISQLSKGMITQLHLAIVMSIDSSLLVLDEPTLGLDIVYRKNFYRDLLDNYFDNEKTIVITTHQIEEIEDLVTRIVFINDGRIVLDESVDNISSIYSEVTVARGNEEEAKALKPMYHSSGLEGTTYWYKNTDRNTLEAMGSVKTPKLADLFVASVMNSDTSWGGLE